MGKDCEDITIVVLDGWRSTAGVLIPTLAHFYRHFYAVTYVHTD